MDIKKKNVIIDGIMGSIVGLFLLTTPVAAPSVSAFNCIDMDCLKEKLRIMCELECKEQQ